MKPSSAAMFRLTTESVRQRQVWTLDLMILLRNSMKIQKAKDVSANGRRGVFLWAVPFAAICYIPGSYRIGLPYSFPGHEISGANQVCHQRVSFWKIGYNGHERLCTSAYPGRSGLRLYKFTSLKTDHGAQKGLLAVPTGISSLLMLVFDRRPYRYPWLAISIASMLNGMELNIGGAGACICNHSSMLQLLAEQ